jgi:hypothetical protein
MAMLLYGGSPRSKERGDCHEAKLDAILRKIDFDNTTRRSAARMWHSNGADG